MNRRVWTILQAVLILSCVTPAGVRMAMASPATAKCLIVACAPDQPPEESQVEAATLVIVVEGMMKSRSGAT